MHTARQLQATSFDIEIDGASSDFEGLFPGWDRNDRFGIVVNEPFGGFGANLLLQAAIASYFDVRRDTHAAVPTYPEVYLFHVGGRFGDFSMYDVTPRKEIFVGTDPWELVVAIVERGITRLAVPDGQPSEFDYVHNAGGWFYAMALVDHVSSAFAYGQGGVASDPDVELRTDDESLLDNRSACLDLEGLRVQIDAVTEETVGELQLGHTSMGDMGDYSHQIAVRADEVPIATRRGIAARYEGIKAERHRRIDGDETLRLLKRCCESVSGEFSGASPAYPYREWRPLVHV